MHLQECPIIEEKADPYTLVTYDGLYQTNNSFVTTDQIAVADYSKANNSLTCTQELCYPDPSDPQSAYNSYGVNKGQGFAWFALDSYEVLWRCVVRDEAKEALYAVAKTNETEDTTSAADVFADAIIPESQVTEAFKGGSTFFVNLYGDLWLARYYILGIGFGASLVRSRCRINISLYFNLLIRIPF